MKYNDLIYSKLNKVYYSYIMYRSDLELHVLEPLNCQLKFEELWITHPQYIHVKKSDFYKNYLTESYQVKNYIYELLNKSMNVLNDKYENKLFKINKKKSILQSQLDCMIKLEKSQKFIKSWKKAINRELKKEKMLEINKEKELVNISNVYNSDINILSNKKKKYGYLPFFA